MISSSISSDFSRLQHSKISQLLDPQFDSDMDKLYSICSSIVLWLLYTTKNATYSTRDLFPYDIAPQVPLIFFLFL